VTYPLKNQPFSCFPSSYSCEFEVVTCIECDAITRLHMKKCWQETSCKCALVHKYFFFSLSQLFLVNHRQRSDSFLKAFLPEVAFVHIRYPGCLVIEKYYNYAIYCYFSWGVNYCNVFLSLQLLFFNEAASVARFMNIWLLEMLFSESKTCSKTCLATDGSFTCLSTVSKTPICV